MKRSRPAHDATPRRSHRTCRPLRAALLIVDPNELTRWSLKTFLGRWYTVVVVRDAESALAYLRSRRVVALITSDEVPPVRLERLESQVRAGNQSAKLIRMVIETPRWGSPPPGVALVEKPFQLARIAELLGVPGDQLRS